MIEITKDTKLQIDKTIDDEIIIKNDVNLELDIIGYLNVRLNITISKKSKANIFLITKNNIKLTLNINVEEDANIKGFVAFFGKKSNTDIKVNLIGKNSSTYLTLINMSNSSTSTHYTNVFHLHENTNSIILNSAILNNESTCLMEVKSNIKNKSIKSNSNQSIEAICLDNKSKLEMLPTLHIDENDIFAKHSSKVARITDKDLHYIMSKGISEKDANKLYANSFLLRVTPDEFKERIEKLIERSI